MRMVIGIQLVLGGYHDKEQLEILTKVRYLSIRIIWSSEEIPNNFTVVNHLLQLERSTAESLHWAS